MLACSLLVPFADYEVPVPVDACSDDACIAPPANDASTCDANANLKADSVHCGACDHSCLGRACVGGVCEPETVFVVSAALYAAGLSLDKDFVYLAGGSSMAGAQGAIVRVAKTSLLSATTVASVGAPVFRVVDTGSELFWTQGALGDAGPPNRGIGRVVLPGVGSFVAPWVGNQSSPYALAFDETSIFWSNFLGDGDVWQAARAGAPGEHRIAAAQGAAGVAVDASHVFWTTALPVGNVMRASKDGANAVPLAMNQSFPFAIFVDDESVYWTNFTAGGSVMRVSKSGGAPIEIARDQERPNSVWVDGASVYWSNAGPTGSALGSVSRAPKDGGRPILLAVGTAPSDLAVDGVHAYWASGGSVFRVPK